MAYNYPQPPLDIPDGGPPPPIGGFGFPGFGKHFNLDVGAGLGGFPGGGFFGGGFPGWGGPYVPITPLGGLWGFKGDLIVPIVAIGVAIFLFILVVLAVKYALAWKLEVLEDVAGMKANKFLRRDAPAAHLEDDQMNRLADAVAAAIYSEGCSKRFMCEIGAYARDGKQYTSLIKLVKLIVPDHYHNSFDIIEKSADGSFECSDHYPCGTDSGKPPSAAAAANPAENEIDDTTSGGGTTSTFNQTSPAQSTFANNNTSPANASNPSTATTTPAPGPFGKFTRAFLK